MKCSVPVICLGLFLALGIGVGCTSKEKAPELATLTGKVTIKGKPLPGGLLILHPKDPKGLKTSITIKPNGTFEENNVPVGEMLVSFDTENVKKWMEMKGKMAEMPIMPTISPKDVPKDKIPTKEKIDRDKVSDPMAGMEYVEIPGKYRDPATSGLSVTITAGRQEKSFTID